MQRVNGESVKVEEIKLNNKYDLFIGGEWVKPSTGEYLQDINPWNGEIFAEVAAANTTDINLAVEAAVIAQKEWKKFVPSQKEKILLNAADILEKDKESFIEVLCEESGSSLKKAQHEIGFMINVFRTAAGECRRVKGEVIPSETPGLISMTVREPRGVVAAIGPYNYPFLLLSKKVAFGLAAGNGLVIKSSSETPVVAYKLATLLDSAGVPKGLVNAISGRGGEVGDSLTLHPKVNMVAFTGSTNVGRHIGKLASETFKKVTLELGGKSPMIILKDADLEYAVNAATFGIFDHQGQICMVNSRILVEREIYEEFLFMFKKKAESLSIGNSINRDVVIGPIINQKQVDSIHDHVKDALSKGAELVTGGTYNELFYKPTILADVTPNMKVYSEETFGPVAVVIPVDTIEEAIDIANSSQYGLSSAVLTNDITAAIKIARELEAGAVHINDSSVYDEPMTPHGGVKETGTGREGSHYSIEEMTEPKWITITTEKKVFPF